MGTYQSSNTVAVVQHPPVWMNRAATLQRAVGLVAEAAANGAQLVTFPEAFVPGFPIWVWRLRTADGEIARELYARIIEEAVDLDGSDLQPLQQAARTHAVTVVCGINERAGRFSGTTLYNSVVVIGPDGTVRNRHRKLVPTNAERLVWAMGDGAGLRVVDTPAGALGALICWENYMPMARYALYAQGIQIYVAPTWDTSTRWITSMQHIAVEGRCWVLGNGNILSNDDVPPDVPGRSSITSPSGSCIAEGGSVIVNPEGEIVAGPLRNEAGILYADCDPTEVARSRYWLDVAGHYGRPDIFRLQVNRSEGRPLEIVTTESTWVPEILTSGGDANGRQGVPTTGENPDLG